MIGAGPNGLAAAIVLAQHGVRVQVFEAESQPGGGVRTMELTLPGFRHDFGSAVYPFAAGSPFFSTLPLADYGLRWIHSNCPLAHPFDDGTAITLERNLDDAAAALGKDGPNWRRVMEPLARNWSELSAEALAPVHVFTPHPILLMRFGLLGFPSARILNRAMFRGERARALFAGLAAHSFLSLDEPLSAAFGVLLGAAAHAVGWPIAERGAQSLTEALCAHLHALGGELRTSTRMEKLSALPPCDVTLCDVTPRHLVEMAGNRLSAKFARKLADYRYGPGAFKVDYALSEPIPWKAAECLRAATIHLGGSESEIAASEAAMRGGQHASRPFVLLVQPSLFDRSRAPNGQHTAWAYCHVPNGSKVDMLQTLEAQIERFAPGFRAIVLVRRVFSPAALEKMDANLVGGDIVGGAVDLRQFFFRPTWRRYATSAKDIFLCSASTPPGGGVHGMCGYHAARVALSRLGMLHRTRFKLAT